MRREIWCLFNIFGSNVECKKLTYKGVYSVLLYPELTIVVAEDKKECLYLFA